MRNSQVIPIWNWGSIRQASLALAAGLLIDYFGLRLLGVRIEIFTGIQYFNLIWFIALFMLPLAGGVVVSWIYGLGGKYLAYLPPLPVMGLDYYLSMHTAHLPVGEQLMPLGWWGFFVILSTESSAIGGVFGEIMNKRIYGRDTPAPDAAERKQ